MAAHFLRRVVTVHRRLWGRAVATSRPDPLLDVLEALAQVPTHRDLAVLPVPDGKLPFDPDVPFGDSLAGLVLRRVPLRGRRLADGVAARLADALRSLAPVPARLVHGDLGPVHVLLDHGRPVGLLDFGDISTVGDPAFDAAVGAALQDMFGPAAAAATVALDDLAVRRFGYEPGRHLDWCLALVDVWRTTGVRP